MKKKLRFLNNIHIILFILTTMFLISVCDNLRGPYSIQIKNYFQINNTQLSLIFIVSSLSYMFFSMFSGFLCRRIGHKNSICIGFVLIILSIVKILLSLCYSDFLIGLFITNAGEALILVGINTIIPTMNIKYKAIVMNLLHFSYGIGAAFIQKKSAFMIKHNFDFIHVHFVLGIIFIIWLFQLFNINLSPIPSKNKTSQNILPTNKKLLLSYLLALGLYLSAEVSTANWFTNFIGETYGYNESFSSKYLSLFFIFIAIGRVLGGFIVEKVGYLKSSLYALLTSTILFTFGYILGLSGFLLISLSGLFFSIYYPTMLLTIKDNFKENYTYITSLVFSFGSLCCIAINFIIGFISDHFGVFKSFYIIPLCLIISLCSTLYIYSEKVN
ncbi:MFS transporter [Clostridium sediminicola]|uniref:MFS transporter n=1 Tax=Clostridium sediminicola TaxID=3114879 RepID=UPI003D17724E